MNQFAISLSLVFHLFLPSIFCRSYLPALLPALHCGNMRHLHVQKCCRIREECPQQIYPFEFGPGNLFNNPSFNDRSNREIKYHCDCEQRFRECLRQSQTEEAHSLGHINFNVMKKRCFKEGREQYCTSYASPVSRLLKFLRSVPELPKPFARLASGRQRTSRQTNDSKKCLHWSERTTGEIKYRFYKPDVF